MDDPFELGEGVRVGEDDGSEGRTIQRPVGAPDGAPAYSLTAR